MHTCNITFTLLSNCYYTSLQNSDVRSYHLTFIATSQFSLHYMIFDKTVTSIR